MASKNGYVGNCYYMDSAGTVGNRKQFISNISFFCTDTTSVLLVALASDTAQVIFKQQSPFHSPAMLSHYLGRWDSGKELYVPTITAGTAYFYVV